MIVSAVITGASQGIGRALALAFATEPGARLFLVARNRAALAEVAEECRRAGAHAEALPCDITSEAAVSVLADGLKARGEVPNLLINNAGRFIQQEFFSTTPSDFRNSLESNLVSAFLMTHAFASAMAEKKCGTIFFMGSVASLQGYPDSAAYCAAKHGLLGLARSVRLATRDAGIRVTAILPGATNSPSWDSSEIDTERLMPAEDIAASVLSIYKLSARSVVEEIVLRPIAGDI